MVTGGSFDDRYGRYCTSCFSECSGKVLETIAFSSPSYSRENGQYCLSGLFILLFVLFLPAVLGRHVLNENARSLSTCSQECMHVLIFVPAAPSSLRLLAAFGWAVSIDVTQDARRSVIAVACSPHSQWPQ